MKTVKNFVLITLAVLVLGCAHHDPWTKTDTTLAILSITASALDAYTTRAGNFDHYCHPMMNDGNIEVVIGVTEAVVLGVSWLLPMKLRRAVLISNITMRTGFSLHNVVQNK